jgi:hypothetical protein
MRLLENRPTLFFLHALNRSQKSKRYSQEPSFASNANAAAALPFVG